jgi:hypothetical protein
MAGWLNIKRIRARLRNKLILEIVFICRIFFTVFAISFCRICLIIIEMWETNMSVENCVK